MTERLLNRTVIAVAGTERHDFLQGLITNDVARLSDGLVYAALLTPQGKFQFDFFLFEQGDAIMLDTPADRASDLARILTFYRLRRPVDISLSDVAVKFGFGERIDGAVPDPRCPDRAWRQYGQAGGQPSVGEWDSFRVDHCIPESGIELVPDVTFILEAGFERLNGVDFKKGCFVGQEVTARMKHKSRRSKGLVTVEVDGAAESGTLLFAGSRKVGYLCTRSGSKAIAHLRFDRLGQSPILAGKAEVRILDPAAEEPG